MRNIRPGRPRPYAEQRFPARRNGPFSAQGRGLVGRLSRGVEARRAGPRHGGVDQSPQPYKGMLIVAITARPEKWRALTAAWLTKHRIPVDEILMRADDAFRPSVAMKLELAAARFPNLRDEVLMLIEDRADVCDAFRALGITVLQVHARRD